VVYVQNVTDVDDPLLERAAQTGTDWRELAESQTDLFRSDMTALRVIPPDHYVGAVEAMDLVVEAVERMLADGTAYRVPLPAGAGGDTPELGDVYADLSVDPLFGTGAHLQLDQMIEVFAENGGDPDREGKRHALDPLLWRRTRVGEPDWDGGTLGRGRPGWHIECACIAGKHLGPLVEVQGGGRDLIFPHHEMSESHLRVLHGTPTPVMIHNHGGMVGHEGEKMSKSLGNLVLVSELVAGGTDPMAVRLGLLAHHYHSDWEYTDAGLTAAVERLDLWRRATAGEHGPAAEPLLQQVREALADDLDSPRALTAVDDWARAALAGEGEQVGGAPDLVRRTVDALLGIAL
jgi:L-cysteine:1D-myo-inositol 2-amino-2-deoxy-alpha-D-glucopyranoside ligase